jgi:hypothetical protein
MTGNLIKKTKRNINDFGMAYTSFKIIKALFEILYESKALIIYELNFTKGYEAKKIDGVTIRPLRPDEYAYIAQIVEMEEWLENTIANRITQNGICIVAIKGGQLIGFNLIAYDWIELPLLKIKVDMRSDEAWSEQISVKKEYRKKGIANEMRKATYKILKQKRIVKLYGHRAGYNYASKMSASKFTKNEILYAQYNKILRHEKIDLIDLKNFGKVNTFSFNSSKAIRAQNGYLILRSNRFMNLREQNQFTPDSLSAVSRI